jgi:hypothetical protein
LTGLGSFQRELLEAFFEREHSFFLTGGGALVGFYLKHRETRDLDLFSTEDRLDDGESALLDAARAMGATVESILKSPTSRRFLVSRGPESVVVDLVRDLTPQLKEPKPEVGGIRMDSIEEIMANKLCTLLSRAEIRDLVDVLALENAGYTVEEHLPLAAKKDAGLTPGQLAWVLSEMEIGADARPPGVSPVDLRHYLEDLRRRLADLAYPERSDS